MIRKFCVTLQRNGPNGRCEVNKRSAMNDIIRHMLLREGYTVTRTDKGWTAADSSATSKTMSTRAGLIRDSM